MKKCGKLWKSVEKFEKSGKVRTSLKKCGKVWKEWKSLKKCGKVWKVWKILKRVEKFETFVCETFLQNRFFLNDGFPKAVPQFLQCFYCFSSQKDSLLFIVINVLYAGFCWLFTDKSPTFKGSDMARVPWSSLTFRHYAF